MNRHLLLAHGAGLEARDLSRFLPPSDFPAAARARLGREKTCMSGRASLDTNVLVLQRLPEVIHVCS